MSERIMLPVLSPLCRRLRTKTAFGTMQPGAPDWQTGDSTTATYWCLGTMETAGLDQGYAHPHSCREGRSCHAPGDDAAPLATS